MPYTLTSRFYRNEFALSNNWRPTAVSLFSITFNIGIHALANNIAAYVGRPTSRLNCVCHSDDRPDDVAQCERESLLKGGATCSSHEGRSPP